tara:strand:+ start:700 stop:936 length:237 start_codon:yes stop_codon:yes gene_type:complete
MVVVAVDQQVEDQTMVHLKELLEVEALEVVELQVHGKIMVQQDQLTLAVEVVQEQQFIVDLEVTVVHLMVVLADLVKL